MASKQIFRAQALEKLSSPEQLDQLLALVDRKSWLPLLFMAGALCLAVLWGVFGRIPITVDGEGVLVYPRRIASLQSPASGQIIALNVAAGDFVQKGQVLARLNQPDIAQQLEQERIKLADLGARSDRILALQRQRIELEKQAVAKQRALLSQRIEAAQKIADEVMARNKAFVAKQHENLKRLLAVSETLGKALNERFQNFLSLRKQGISSEESVLEARRSVLDNEVQMADLELRMTEIDLREIESQDALLQQVGRINEMRTQLQELEIRDAQLDQQLAESTSDTELQILEVQRNIDRYERELETKGRIVSEYSGRILEITSAAGQFISAGQRIGSVETEDERGELFALAYFRVGDGKQIEPAMSARIAPATVERERFGSLLGEVTSVSRFPVTVEAVTNVVGSAEMARGFAGQEPKIEIFARLQSDPQAPSGYRWTSGAGPETRITAGTTLTIRVIVAQRRPITYVIPLLRRWSGL